MSLCNDQNGFSWQNIKFLGHYLVFTRFSGAVSCLILSHWTILMALAFIKLEDLPIPLFKVILYSVLGAW